MEIVRECDNSCLRAGHHQTWILPLFRLAMQVGHRPRMPVPEPAVKLRRVRVTIERRDPNGREAELGTLTFYLDASARRLRSTFLLDGVHGFHSPIVSRRQRAKFK